MLRPLNRSPEGPVSETGDDKLTASRAQEPVTSCTGWRCGSVDKVGRVVAYKPGGAESSAIVSP